MTDQMSWHLRRPWLSSAVHALLVVAPAVGVGTYLKSLSWALVNLLPLFVIGLLIGVIRRRRAVARAAQ